MKSGDRAGLINTRPGHGGEKTRFMSMRLMKFAVITPTRRQHVSSFAKDGNYWPLNPEACSDYIMSHAK
jgi:hypothetical protein